MSERLALTAMAKLDGIIEDRISRENRQLGFIPDAEIDFLQEHAEHLVQVSYDGSWVRGFGCKPDSPPEIVARVERVIADSVEAMIAAGHQPAILPRSTADAIARMGIGATGFSTLYGGDTRSKDGFMDVWGTKS